MELQQIVEILVKKMVEEPDQVKITGVQEEKCLVFKARVAQPDMGRVIGRKGRNIEALRAIIQACGIKKNKHCMFELVEEDEVIEQE